jgi:diaminopimelate epimerase
MGACAAAIVGIQQGVLKSPVTVQAKGGTLTINWQGKIDDFVFMRGPAVTVFKGTLNLTPLK